MTALKHIKKKIGRTTEKMDKSTTITKDFNIQKNPINQKTRY